MQLPLLTFWGLLSIPLLAQDKKDLTYEQIWKNAPTCISRPLPSIGRWIDDTHYYDSWDIVDIKTGIVRPDVVIQQTPPPIAQQNATPSPDHRYYAFTRNNDLYTLELATQKETRLTTDGSDVIHNGYASWVYYEEILGRSTQYRAFWWSPDSKSLVYMRFDDAKVPIFPLFNEKGTVEQTRYPTPGDNNPIVKVGIVPATGGHTTWANFGDTTDQYFGSPFWTEHNHLWLQWMNRGQDHLAIYDIDLQTGAKREMYAEQQATWVDWKNEITVLDNGKGFILKSDRSGWPHLYWYNMDGTLKKQLTSGNWSVTDAITLDARQEYQFFTARKEAPTRTDLYKVNLKTGAITRLTFGNYSHSVSVSPHGDYFITTYSNLSTPPRMALVNNKGKVIHALGDSKGPNLDQYNYAVPKLLTYTTRDGLTLPMTVNMPLHMETGKRYPVVISIYGGPNAGTVHERWNGNLTTQWWAQKGIIQVVIDNRSSGQLGKTGMNYIHRKMGIYETEDYMDAAKWLRSQPYVDTNKVCIVGGSFGGYMTCMALTYGAAVFNYGIASYAVTDWQLYDSHYTERYMDTPAENPEGYRITSPMNYLDRYKGLIRIIHGTMDNNVHPQNSLLLISRLEDMNKHFEFNLYPGERHGWRTSIKQTHSDQETYRFIYRYLLEEPFPVEGL